MLGQVRLDENQVVQCNLQGGVAGARSTKSLLDEGAQRKHTTSSSGLATALGLRKLPDNLNHLGCGIFGGTSQRGNEGSRVSMELTDEAVDEVDLSVALSNQLRRSALVDRT